MTVTSIKSESGSEGRPVIKFRGGWGGGWGGDSAYETGGGACHLA